MGIKSFLRGAPNGKGERKNEKDDFCFPNFGINSGRKFLWVERHGNIETYSSANKDRNCCSLSRLPKEIASFSGRWEGIWEEGPLNAILIIEKIDSKEARVIYGWGDCDRWYAKRDYAYIKAKVIPGLKPMLEFINGNRKFTFKMGKDFKTINGTLDLGTKYNVTMKKIEGD